MAPSTRKRIRVDDSHTRKTKKRRRNTDDSSPSTGKHSIPTTRSELDADALDWKEVALPDRLEDAEGFLGLEEIEGVAVLRPNGTDKPPRFKVQAHLQANPLEIAVKKSTPHGKSKPEANTPVAEVAAEEEWSGISDDEPTQALSEEPNSVRKKQNQPKLTKGLQKVAPKSTRNGDPDVRPNVDFSLLDNGREDDIDMSAWAPLDLSPETLSGIAKLKFTRPTPIQSACIPEILAGHDVIGKASTGSGKTLAFGVPILERFLERSQSLSSKKSHKPKIPIALVISPTRELAHQLNAHLIALNSGALDDGLRIATVTGGLSVQKQQRLLADADVVVGTPGRLWEIISQGHGLIERLKLIKYLVVDEADRLLSEGHFKEVEEILNALDGEAQDIDEPLAESSKPAASSQQRQTLVFSATFRKSLQQKLAGKSKASSESENLLNNQQSLEYLLQKLTFQSTKPKFIDVDPMSQMATSLQEGLLECGAMEKDLYLYALLLLHPPSTRILIFTNSIASVKRLVPLLQSLNLSALPLHSSMAQKARLRSMERFSSSSKNQKGAQTAAPGYVLIASDVAARGLDIPNIDLVIHYHVPRTADMYVHRSGRTARASHSGRSILLCAPAEVVPVQRLVAKVHATSSDTKHHAKTLRSLDINRSLVSRLQPRMSLAQKIIATSLAKTKTSSDDNFLRTAADELGVDYSSDDLGDGRRRGRGKGREKQEKKDAGTGKETVRGWKAELKELLGKRVLSGRGERNLKGEEAERISSGGGGIFGDVNDLWGIAQEAS